MSLVPISETLRLYQEDEERKVMKHANDSTRELIRDIYERTKVTSEDLSRKYTQDEIRELCLRTKVRVNMTHMNCVYEAKKRLDKRDRLTNRSYRFINAMLAKAVNRRMVEPCTDEEVANYHHINVCLLKKDNNCRLDRWKKEFEKQMKQELWEEAGEDTVEDANDPIQATTPNEEQNEYDVSVGEEIDFGAEVMADNHSKPDVPHMPDLETECMGIGDDNEDEELNQPNYNDQSNVAGGNGENQGAVVPTQLPLPTVDWLRDVQEINSESMTLNSLEMLQTQSQSEALSADYISFNTQVPATSTQDSDTQVFL